jgi:hypothetical protein
MKRHLENVAQKRKEEEEGQEFECFSSFTKLHWSEIYPHVQDILSSVTTTSVGLVYRVRDGYQYWYEHGIKY